MLSPGVTLLSTIELNVIVEPTGVKQKNVPVSLKNLTHKFSLPFTTIEAA